MAEYSFIKDLSEFNVDFQHAITLIYENFKNLHLQTILSTTKKDYFLILELLSKLMIQVELLRIKKNRLSGPEKKRVVLILCRYVITEHVTENEDLLLLYDEHADNILEKLVETSRGVNMYTFTGCCFTR